MKTFGDQAPPFPTRGGPLDGFKGPRYGREGRAGKGQRGKREEGSSLYHQFVDTPLVDTMLRKIHADPQCIS